MAEKRYVQDHNPPVRPKARAWSIEEIAAQEAPLPQDFETPQFANEPQTAMLHQQMYSFLNDPREHHHHHHDDD